MENDNNGANILLNLSSSGIEQISKEKEKYLLRIKELINLNNLDR